MNDSLKGSVGDQGRNWESTKRETNKERGNKRQVFVVLVAGARKMYSGGNQGAKRTCLFDIN